MQQISWALKFAVAAIFVMVSMAHGIDMGIWIGILIVILLIPTGGAASAGSKPSPKEKPRSSQSKTSIGRKAPNDN